MQERKNTLKIADFADKSLLIVDDDNPLRDSLSRAMEKKGFMVRKAESVKQGIIHAKDSPPAFAVVDLRLNDGNGLEVVKEIQKQKKKRKDSRRAEGAPIECFWARHGRVTGGENSSSRHISLTIEKKK